MHRYCRLIKTLLLHRISVADLLSNYMHNYPSIDSVMFGVLIAIRYIYIYLFIGHCQFSNDTFFSHCLSSLVRLSLFTDCRSCGEVVL